MKESLKDKMEYHNSVIKALEQKITILQKIIDAAELFIELPKFAPGLG